MTHHRRFTGSEIPLSEIIILNYVLSQPSRHLPAQSLQ